jgi:hypothetical protein
MADKRVRRFHALAGPDADRQEITSASQAGGPTGEERGRFVDYREQILELHVRDFGMVPSNADLRHLPAVDQGESSTLLPTLSPHTMS